MKHCPQCSTGYPDSHITCPTHGVLLNEIRDLKPGMVIHQSYRIVRKLGQGGMGAVYLAQHILMDEPRALKFLSPELSRDQACAGSTEAKASSKKAATKRAVSGNLFKGAGPRGEILSQVEFRAMGQRIGNRDQGLENNPVPGRRKEGILSG